MASKRNTRKPKAGGKRTIKDLATVKEQAVKGGDKKQDVSALEDKFLQLHEQQAQNANFAK